MNRPILACMLFAVASAALGAQQASPSTATPYEGTSAPPADDTIMTSEPAQAKPPAGRPANAAPAASVAQTQAPQQPQQFQPQPGQSGSSDPSANYPNPDGDAGVVQPGQPAPYAPAPDPRQPALSARSYDADPDGDIVHPRPLRPGELEEGTVIWVRLLDRLSTADSGKGETFRSRVSADVLQDGQVLIPAGSEISGRVADVSSGHAGGHGSMRLRPEAVMLPNGMRYRLDAETTATSGSKTHVVGEGTITPDSRAKRDGIEYGGAVGAGAVTGAILGGPVGALAGSLIGAGAVTVHLLVDHPQATLEPGAALMFTLTERMNLVAGAPSGN